MFLTQQCVNTWYFWCPAFILSHKTHQTHWGSRALVTQQFMIPLPITQHEQTFSDHRPCNLSMLKPKIYSVTMLIIQIMKIIMATKSAQIWLDSIMLMMMVNLMRQSADKFGRKVAANMAGFCRFGHSNLFAPLWCSLWWWSQFWSTGEGSFKGLRRVKMAQNSLWRPPKTHMVEFSEPMS